MLRKQPTKPSGGPLVTGFKVFLLGEAVLFGGAYYLWWKMNNSQEFRKKMYDGYPSILNSYYWVGETMGGLDTRQQDYKTWGVEEKN